MNEKQLVSFGNYLLQKYNVQVYSTDGKNKQIYQREVDNADLSNWKYANLDLLSELPSQLQIGDDVCLNFEKSGKVNNAKIIKVHFTDRKVLYDVEIECEYEETDINNMGIKATTRLYNVDSCFVFPVI